MIRLSILLLALIPASINPPDPPPPGPPGLLCYFGGGFPLLPCAVVDEIAEIHTIIRNLPIGL